MENELIHSMENLENMVALKLVADEGATTRLDEAYHFWLEMKGDSITMLTECAVGWVERAVEVECDEGMLGLVNHNLVNALLTFGLFQEYVKTGQDWDNLDLSPIRNRIMSHELQMMVGDGA